MIRNILIFNWYGEVFFRQIKWYLKNKIPEVVFPALVYLREGTSTVTKLLEGNSAFPQSKVNYSTLS